MLFNSIDFAIFLPIVFVLYWFVTNRNLKLQNLLIVAASYLFYGWWDYRFLLLIVFSTVVDYSIGLKLKTEVHEKKRFYLLWLSILINLGFLGFFKYYNFFIDNFIQAFSFFGASLSPNTLNIILPVGISFYTFQTLSYTIDIYKRRLEPTVDFVSFAAFVCFFPQLVAGPIERATSLLPQFYKTRTFNYGLAIDGLRQILWGLIKKIVIADNAAQIANEIFNNSDVYSGSTLILGAFFFAIQLYGDFSGYSDIAIGISRLFGFNLMQNFSFPYFSRDIAEFWRRWHISLSTWFRDYLYVPLGGSRGSRWLKIRNVFIIFIVSGFWHGANWTFVVWGALNALYFLPLLLLNKNRIYTNTVADGKLLPSLKEFFQMLITFLLYVFSLIFFRATDMGHAVSFITSIFSSTLFDVPYYSGIGLQKDLFVLVVIFFAIEWLGRNGKYALEQIVTAIKIKALRYASYTLMLFIIYYYSVSMDTNQFIYFQF
jgi:D-alanyl-lipoteichoic acid acyltransferase DltB (MBOAT superfamily)